MSHFILDLRHFLVYTSGIMAKSVSRCPYREQLEAAGTWPQFVRDRTAARLAGEPKPDAQEYLPGGKKFAELESAGLLKFGPVAGIVGAQSTARPQPLDDKAAEDFLALVSRSDAPPAPLAEPGPTKVEEAPSGKASLLTKAFEAIGGFERLVRHLTACQLGSRELSTFYASVFEEDALKSGKQFEDAGAEADGVIDSLLAGAPGEISGQGAAGGGGECPVAPMGEGVEGFSAATGDVDGV